MPIRRRIGLRERFLRWQETSILVVAVLLIAYFESANRDFLLSGASLQNLTQYIAPAAIIACGEIMLMIMGEIDLSAGMVFALAPFVMHFAAEAGVPAPLALIVGVASGAAVGLLNGLITVKLSVPSFVTTLGHVVPDQRFHPDDLRRHAGRTARRSHAGTSHGRMGLQ